MTTISICANKGGVGKTTTLVALSFYLASLYPSKKIYLLDADPQQNTCRWVEGILLSNMRSHHVGGEEELTDIYESINKEDNPLIIIDCPTGLEIITRTAILLSEYLIVPTQPHYLDLYSNIAVVKYLKQIQKLRKDGYPQMLTFLNRCTPRTILTREAESFLNHFAEENGILFLKSKIHHRQEIADSPNQKAILINSDTKSGIEFIVLCKEISQKLYKEVK